LEVGVGYVALVPLPRRIALFNKRYTNRLIEPIVRRVPGFVAVHHRGRITGGEYRTPLFGFSSNGGLLIALTYGTQADWVQNVLASGGYAEQARERRLIKSAQLVHRRVAGPQLPVPARAVLAALGVADFLLIHLESNAR